LFYSEREIACVDPSGCAIQMGGAAVSDDLKTIFTLLKVGDFVFYEIDADTGDVIK